MEKSNNIDIEVCDCLDCEGSGELSKATYTKFLKVPLSAAIRINKGLSCKCVSCNGTGLSVHRTGTGLTTTHNNDCDYKVNSNKPKKWKKSKPHWDDDYYEEELQSWKQQQKKRTKFYNKPRKKNKENNLEQRLW